MKVSDRMDTSGVAQDGGAFVPNAGGGKVPGAKRLLILNMEVSGMNKHLFSQLRSRGWTLHIIDVPYPRFCRWWALASTFRPDVKKWKQEFTTRINKIHKTSAVFRLRSRYCARMVKKLAWQFDDILQIAGTFAPFDPQSSAPPPKFKLLISYTMKLSKGFPEWEPYAHEFEKWISAETLLYRSAEKIFTTNENVRKSLHRDYGVPAEKVIKIGYGVTLANDVPREKTYDGKTVLFIGIDFRRKGGYILLDAFAKLRESIPAARLLVVGPNKEILNLDQPGVELLGHLSDRVKIRNLYEEASIFVMPSLMEPFGLVFLEAMAFKLPCIGTTVDAMPEIIEDGKTGYLVPPGDADYLAERMAELLRDKEKMKEMGDAAARRGKEFSWDRVGEKLVRHLD